MTQKYNLSESYLQAILSKPPIQRLVHWIEQREKVRNAKELGEELPWTEDEILQQFRFCNVRRMDDKVSVWIYDNWYLPHFNHPKMLYAVSLARFINKPATLKLITNLVFVRGKINWDLIKIRLRKHRDAGNTVFNGAYVVRGNDGVDKISSVVDFYTYPLRHVGINTDSMEETHAALQASHGFGSFMAGQVVADLRWAVEGDWSDRMIWAPIGPGSKRGMNRLLERELKSRLSQEEFLEELNKLIKKLSTRLTHEISSRLEAHDYQNCLCEFDKFERGLYGQGRIKQKYQGV